MSGFDDPVGRRHIRPTTDCRMDWAGSGRVGKRHRPTGSGGPRAVKNAVSLPDGCDTFLCGCTWKLMLYVFCLRAEGRPTADQLAFRVLIEQHLEKLKRSGAKSCSCRPKIELAKRYILEYEAGTLPLLRRVATLKPPLIARTDFDLIAEQVDEWYRAG